MAVFGRSFPISRAVTINRVKSTAAPRLSKLRGLALDGKASGQFTSTNTGTVTLSTTQSNDVIVLFYYGENNNGSSPARTVTSVTSANLTWTLRSTYSMAAGHEQEIWWAIASAPLTNEVITVTVSGVTDGAAMVAFGVSGSNYLTAPWDTNASLSSAHALASGTFPSGTVSSSVTFSTDSSTSMVIGFVGTSDNVSWVIPTETYPVFGEVNNASGSRWARQVNFYDEYSSTLSSTTLSVRAPNGGVISFNGLVVDALNGASKDTLTAGLVTDTDTFYAPELSGSANFLARASVNTTHSDLYKTLIDGLINAGVWSKYDVIQVYATQTSTAALLNLKSVNYSATANGGVTFTADRGFTGTSSDGSKYIDSGFNAATAVGAQYTQNSAHISAWSVTGTSFNDPIMGVVGGSGETEIRPRNGANLDFRVNSSGLNSVAISTALGHTLANRSASNAVQAYRDGASITTGTTASTALVSTNFDVIGEHNSGGGHGGSGHQVALATMGGSLNSTEVSDSYTLFRAFLQGVGVVDQTLTPGLVTDTDTFFAPSLVSTITLTAGLVTDTDTFFAPTESANITLTAGLVTDTDTFFAPSVVITDQTLLPTLVTDTDTFFAPTVTAGSVTLTAGLVTDTDTFFAPAVSAGDVTLTAGLVTDTDTFFAPTLSATITLTAGLVTDTDTFFAPTVTAQGGVSPGLVTDTDTFFAPTVVPGSVSLLPVLVTDTDTFFAPTVDARTSLLPALVTDTDTFFAPTVVPGAITLLPDLVTDDDTIFAITAPNTTTLSPPFIDSDAVIYSPLVSKIGELLPPLVTATDTLFAPTLVPGPVSVLPSRVIDLDIFLSPLVGIVKSNGSGGGTGGGNVTSDLKYASQLTMTESGLVIALQANASIAKTVNTRMVIYADVAGLPGAQLGKSAVKTSVVVGANQYSLLVPVSLLVGQKVWIALHSDGNFSWFLTTSAGGSKFNTDLFSDGPSDPFGPTSNDNKKAPVFLLFLSAANAGMTPGLITDTDTFYAPAISGSKTLLAPFLVDTDFFYAPSTLSADNVLPSLVSDDDSFYAPSVTNSASILPGLVSSDDVIVSPFVSKSDYIISSANVPSDDVFRAPTVSQSGANLQPTLFTDTDTFYAPFVAAFAPTIFSANVPSDDVFFSPVVTVSGAALTAALFDDTDSFYSPFVSRSVYLIFSANVPSDDVIHQATVTSFGAGLPPSLVTDTDVFFAPTVLDSYPLAPSLHGDTDTIFAPTLSSGVVTLVPELITSGEDFFDPVVTRLLGTTTFAPARFVDTDTFYTASTGNKTGRRQVNISGRNDSHKSVTGAG